jgi:hypothetical protein
MADGGVSDPGAVRELTGGGIIRYKDVEALLEAGVAIETEGPPGLELHSPLQPPWLLIARHL